MTFTDFKYNVYTVLSVYELMCVGFSHLCSIGEPMKITQKGEWTEGYAEL